ncbi:pilus assembly protein FimV [Polynucleobacter paneuropaeus]|nr:pilus assembly protein FimV [Polynucleobacter paneuropaeus]MBT8531352.1 pilus assembly protein FimV [Polynucleobacter paneuropaeus]MBT8602091.1 pilus assembly protein FimV [Polynucleobacter paneuropaeus]MBT8624043.1 pilus assembly protein FimV [Polynucleobacter paneuropaeus]MBT8629072.1 pilus assembly protein FimV [Polynucleobacter paneuropaeus]
MRFSRRVFTQLACGFLLSWSCVAGAISLGSPQIQSQVGQPLRVEIPIRVSAQEQDLLESLKVQVPSAADYARLGISGKVLNFNMQSMVYRNKDERLMVLVETVDPIPVSDDPFVDLLIQLNWSTGSLSKAYTLLLGDAQKIIVKPGQNLSEIAAQMAPYLEGASLDQTMMALFKANPDAFASGSINVLAAGAELNKPSQALLRSISPAEASRFVAQANAQWQANKQDQVSNSSAKQNSDSKNLNGKEVNKDRLKIGPSASDAQEKAYAEELVAKEKVLEQTRAKIAELEKNIAELQKLVDQAKGKKSIENNYGLGGFGPALIGLGLIALTGLMLWALARNARKSETVSVPSDTTQAKTRADMPVPDRAKSLFAGINLDLEAPAKADVQANALADTLRVKLNLARAYLTIEDYAAARRSLEEIVLMSPSVDPLITIEAQGLLAELAQRNA